MNYMEYAGVSEGLFMSGGAVQAGLFSWSFYETVPSKVIYHSLIHRAILMPHLKTELSHFICILFLFS